MNKTIFLILIILLLGTQVTFAEIFSFSGSVSESENETVFSKELPNHLFFQLIPIHAGGWVARIIDPNNPSEDFAIFNEPYHYRNALDLSTDYGTKAEEVLRIGEERAFYFVLTHKDYLKGLEELNALLHPRTDKDRKLVYENLYKDIQLYHGKIKITDAKITHSDKNNPLGKINSLNVEINLNLPATSNE